jgi:hypothetical protein
VVSDIRDGWKRNEKIENTRSWVGGLREREDQARVLATRKTRKKQRRIKALRCTNTGDHIKQRKEALDFS